MKQHQVVITVTETGHYTPEEVGAVLGMSRPTVVSVFRDRFPRGRCKIPGVSVLQYLEEEMGFEIKEAREPKTPPMFVRQAKAEQIIKSV